MESEEKSLAEDLIDAFTEESEERLGAAAEETGEELAWGWDLASDWGLDWDLDWVLVLGSD